MNKPINPNITIPEGFAANGVKADFDNDKILNGFDRIQPDVLAGDNLNKFIDDTYKGLNYAMAAADAINLINEGETLTVVDGQLTSVGDNSEFPAFCANSGNVDENGKASLLNAPDSGYTETTEPINLRLSDTTTNLSEDGLTFNVPQVINTYGSFGDFTYTFTEPLTGVISITHDAWKNTNFNYNWLLFHAWAILEDDTQVQLFSITNQYYDGSSKGTTDFTGYPTIKAIRIYPEVGRGDTRNWSPTCNCTFTITRRISVSTATSCYFKVGGSYPKLTATNVNGESFNTSYVETLTLDGTEADGTYNVFLTQESKSYILANTIYRQPETPTANENDVWLNTSVEPLTAKKYNGTTWEEFNDVPLGSMTIEDGIIQEVETFGYNFNGYEVNNTPKSKEMVVSWGMPDYANGITISSGFVAPSNGYVQMRQLTNNTYFSVSIDNTAISYQASATTLELDRLYPISKGETITGSFTILTFFPMKGAE